MSVNLNVIARRLKQTLAEQGVTVKHTQAQHLTAQLFGYANWQTAAAALPGELTEKPRGDARTLTPPALPTVVVTVDGGYYAAHATQPARVVIVDRDAEVDEDSVDVAGRPALTADLTAVVDPSRVTAHAQDVDLAAPITEGSGPNTRLSYLYRDASNYKASSHVIVEGHLTWRALTPYLDDGTSFLPGQVDLAALQDRFGTGLDQDDDHVWHDVTGVEFTDRPPTDARDAQALLAAFAEAHADGWDETEEMRHVGLVLPGSIYDEDGTVFESVHDALLHHGWALSPRQDGAYFNAARGVTRAHPTDQDDAARLSGIRTA
ncbi:glyoxalase superfamily protein [Deinococcus soli (ex Cha et al. 2016)]|uniref:Uncharacterized protein n=2 Tax=Deinococcus soli (ex Cha et al. 2016) TaxID=1309411 RepID=A0ACC6KHD2_9DEIO|nr:glyoxalase superfamily protein [Deinococcus soli (ex Cha et al. 2016)]MDR6218862.1 hypothetical protein [Deinococcus soli (ex Cha et al. 2016)]MDR6328659.1 hypothetical protein [Deinococcus soli (ex Cha et al. 2016)]MDR6751854.1 hypothetical protein [Deinococcus soli (ex Cha et al. 2016)]